LLNKKMDTSTWIFAIIGIIFIYLIISSVIGALQKFFNSPVGKGLQNAGGSFLNAFASLFDGCYPQTDCKVQNAEQCGEYTDCLLTRDSSKPCVQTNPNRTPGSGSIISFGCTFFLTGLIAGIMAFGYKYLGYRTELLKLKSGLCDGGDSDKAGKDLVSETEKDVSLAQEKLDRPLEPKEITYLSGKIATENLNKNITNSDAYKANPGEYAEQLSGAYSAAKERTAEQAKNDGVDNTEELDAAVEHVARLRFFNKK